MNNFKRILFNIIKQNFEQEQEEEEDYEAMLLR